MKVLIPILLLILVPTAYGLSIAAFDDYNINIVNIESSALSVIEGEISFLIFDGNQTVSIDKNSLYRLVVDYDTDSSPSYSLSMETSNPQILICNLKSCLIDQSRELTSISIRADYSGFDESREGIVENNFTINGILNEEKFTVYGYLSYNATDYREYQKSVEKAFRQWETLNVTATILLVLFTILMIGIPAAAIWLLFKHFRRKAKK